MAGNRPRAWPALPGTPSTRAGHPGPVRVPGHSGPPAARPPRDHGAGGAAARQIPAPQHPEGPAGGTRARAG